VGLGAGITAGIAFGVSYSPLSGAAAFVAFLLVFGLATNWWLGLVYGCLAGLASGGISRWLPANVNQILEQYLPVGVWDGVVGGLAFGLAAGLVRKFSTSDADRLALGQDAGRIIRDDVVSGLVFGSVVALAVALPFLRFEVPFGSGLDIAARITIALASGLAAGLAAGLLHAQTAARYAAAVVVFALRGSFSHRPARYLKWAQDAGLLRVQGISYRFRDDSLREWLAKPIPPGLDAHAG
jgi:hypothetical protein